MGTQEVKSTIKTQSKDPDTINTIIRWASSGDGLYGRDNILINASVEDFYNDPFGVIEKNITHILSSHKKNVAQMEYLINYEKGQQDILNKTRANGNSKINNKHVTNYAWEFVNFKKGYYVGKPIKYVDLNEEKNDRMKLFNRYIRDVNKASKDLVKYENMLIMGIAHTMTIPKKRDYNIEYESPYDYTILDNKDVCVVKSTDIYKTKLFSMCFSKMLENDGTEYDIFTIYYDFKFLQLKYSNSELILINSGKMPVKDCITEYQLNEQRMGIFEPVINALNSMNTISSNQIDQLEESVNTYLTFENVDISSITSNIDTFREKRILVVNTSNPEAPAKIGSVKIENDNTSINEKYKSIEQRTYDIVGVPMPTSSTGQGVSGEAQQYGGGWENAQNIALVDTQYIMQFEKEDLQKFIYISKSAVNSKIDKNLFASDIEIKYTINKSNNMQTKAQSMTYYIDKGFTREQALTFCEITDDPQTEGKIADENYELQKQKDLEYTRQQKKIESEFTQKQNTNEN